MELRMGLLLFLILFLTGLVVEYFFVLPFYPSQIPISEVPEFIMNCVLTISPWVWIIAIVLAAIALEAR